MARPSAQQTVSWRPKAGEIPQQPGVYRFRDAAGRVLLLRRHGSHWASRLLDTHAHVRLDQTFLTLATSDRTFGSVTFDLGNEAPVWAASLRRVTS